MGRTEQVGLTHTPACAKQIESGKLLQNAGGSARCSKMTRTGGEKGGGGGPTGRVGGVREGVGRGEAETESQGERGRDKREKVTEDGGIKAKTRAPLVAQW